MFLTMSERPWLNYTIRVRTFSPVVARETLKAKLESATLLHMSNILMECCDLSHNYIKACLPTKMGLDLVKLFKPQV